MKPLVPAPAAPISRSYRCQKGWGPPQHFAHGVPRYPSAMMATLARVKADGTPVRARHELPTFADFTDLIGLPEVLDLRRRHI